MKLLNKIDNFFQITKRKSNFKTEIIAGVVTFMTMIYIVMVNATIFQDINSVSYGAIYIATAFSAIVASILLALIAKLPFAQASGMGLNAFFVYTICLKLHFTYANALLIVLAEGVIFVIVSLTGSRQRIFEAIPKSVRIGIPSGIGLFIAFIGLQNAGVIVSNPSTKVALVSLNVLQDASWSTIMPLLAFFVTLIVIAVLSKKNVKGAVLLGMLIGTAFYYLLGLSVKGFYQSINLSFDPIKPFKQFFDESFFRVFKDGFDFSEYLESNGNSIPGLIFMFITTTFSLFLVDMFETIGTLYGVCSRGNLLEEDGSIPRMNDCMLSDALGTCIGSVCGTNTISIYVESSAGVVEGGKTGFTTIVVAFLFMLTMFLSPIAMLIPTYVTSAALVYVGVIMMAPLKEIDWFDLEESVPVFVTLAFIPFAYSISTGIGFGIITYVCMQLLLGNFKKLKPLTLIFGALFVLTFLLTH